ncbi:hypothetical protein MT344_08065 [Clavibacter michiganensis subsp. phaseoli]|uniref:DUF6578 domain-containing protein n=1 Tax=Clavibacter phaseoli TaxID=1734031 RepID=UPI001FB37BEE|nr:DUF6578 domain-containing protein [Clavibacter phaseoli]MCJ1711132.1 hypothetical protein [Clavibacter phaseoli]
MLIWLTDWQVAEDHLLVERDDVVDWTVYPADLDWMARLLGDRRAGIAWQFDTYGDALVQPSRRVRGQMTEIRSVRCRQLSTDEGMVPEPGKAVMHPVRDTSGSWLRHGGTAAAVEAPLPAGDADGHVVVWGSYSSISSQDAMDALSGYIVAVADDTDVAPPHGASMTG